MSESQPEQSRWYEDFPKLSGVAIGCGTPIALFFLVSSLVPGWPGLVRMVVFVISAAYLIAVPLSVVADRTRKRHGLDPRQLEIAVVVEEHASTLRRKRRQLTRVDDYGNVFTDAWEGEVQYFLANVVAPGLGVEMLHITDAEYAREVIDEVTLDQEEDFGARDVGAMDPIEYEHYCADLLREAGWDARVTSATGDQGVDVVATRDGRTVAVQVKRYSGSVGNAAVQEAVAGRAFVGADLAAVVSPASFTRSAVELANVAGVRLLHHEQLRDL